MAYQRVMKNKFLTVGVVLLMLLTSTNLSASTMHHMDASDCTMQVSCNNCFISASIDSPAQNAIPSFCGEFFGTAKLFESYRLIPTTPPPKN